MVVLLGAIPPDAIGLVSGMDQVPPLYLKVGRNLGRARAELGPLRPAAGRAARICRPD